MSPRRLALGLAVAGILALVSACSYVPVRDQASRQSSADYDVSGEIDDARAFVYGGVSVLTFRTPPAFLVIRDSNGQAVQYQQDGTYYRLPAELDTFTVWVNGRAMTFTSQLKTRVFAGAAVPEIEPEPVKLRPVNAPADVAASSAPAALIALSERQLADARKHLRASRGSGADVLEISKRLDLAEAGLRMETSAVVRVTYADGSTEFKPGPAVEKVLIDGGMAAQQVNLRGRTDATAADAANARIALGRALAARKFLVAHGVEDSKICFEGTAAGDTVALSTTAKGRALNRRVDIEFVLAPRHPDQHQACPRT
jgi:outer membrane protein OmpA-like peptidoglycan-associated protein